MQRTIPRRLVEPVDEQLHHGHRLHDRLAQLILWRRTNGDGHLLQVDRRTEDPSRRPDRPGVGAWTRLTADDNLRDCVDAANVDPKL